MSDYDTMLDEFDLTESDMRKLASLPYNVAPLASSYNVTVGNSFIEGQGLFAARPILAGEVIAMATIGRDITSAGRYVNHDDRPNAQMIATRSGNLCEIALRDIAAGEEITNDYRHNAKALYASIAQCDIAAVTTEMVRDSMQAALRRVPDVTAQHLKKSVHAALHRGVH